MQPVVRNNALSDLSGFQGQWGIEREAIRIRQNGITSARLHPFDDYFPGISKDFAECQLELATGVQPGIADALADLRELHVRAYEGMKDELLWPLSMPPLPDEFSAVYPAVFPNTAVGEQQEAYRRYLMGKYGAAVMQISGVHINFSYDEELVSAVYEMSGSRMCRKDFSNNLYMLAARLMLKYAPLALYVLGASPLPGEYIRRCMLNAGIVAEQIRSGISYRSSRYGYRNEESRTISFENLDSYVRSIRSLIRTPGIRAEAHGSSVFGLASEKEVYAPVRIKPRGPSACCSTSLDMLVRDGVGYIEVRLPDVNPYDPLGIAEAQLHFLRLVFMHSVFMKPETGTPARDTDKEMALYEWLSLNGAGVEAKTAAVSLLEELRGTAEILDGSGNDFTYSHMLDSLKRGLMGEAQLLFERVLMDLHAAGGSEGFGIIQAVQHKQRVLEAGYERIAAAI
ncbi:MAG: hypothetical protein ACOCVC_01870 [Spirochaeta sp.]